MKKIRMQKSLVFISVVLVFILTGFIADSSFVSQEANIVFYDFEQSTADKIEYVLKETGIPYKINIDIEHENNLLVVDDGYIIDTLIVLFKHGIYEELTFNFDLIDKLVLDYYDKYREFEELSRHISEVDSFPFMVRECALQHYLSKQLSNLNGVEDAEFYIKITDRINISVILQTTKEFNDNNKEAIVQFLVDTLGEFDLEYLEIIDKDYNIIFSGHRGDKVNLDISKSTYRFFD